MAQKKKRPSHVIRTGIPARDATGKHRNWNKVTPHLRRVNGVQPSVIGAKKKYKKKKISYVTGSELGDVVLGFVGGAVVAVGVNKVIEGQEKIKMYGELVIGAGAAYMGVKKKQPMLLGAGLGMAAVGGMGVARELGIITGMDEIMGAIGFDEIGAGEDTMLIRMNGDDVAALMSGEQPQVVAGEFMAGEFMAGQQQGQAQPSIIGFAE